MSNFHCEFSRPLSVRLACVAQLTMRATTSTTDKAPSAAGRAFRSSSRPLLPSFLVQPLPVSLANHRAWPRSDRDDGERALRAKLVQRAATPWRRISVPMVPVLAFASQERILSL